MNENETFSFESRDYVNPTLSRDEQTDFISTLRETMAGNTAQINADTYALGSQLPSNLGGLSGAEETFTARYQTPQLEQTAADLRTAAQQTALNQALTNLQNAWKKRYQDAVNNYQRRASDPSGTTSVQGNTEFKGQNASGLFSSSITGGYPGTATVMGTNGRQMIYSLDKNGNIGDFMGYADDPAIYGKLMDDSVVGLIGSVASSAPRISGNGVSSNSVRNTQKVGFGGVITPTAMVAGGIK